MLTTISRFQAMQYTYTTHKLANNELNALQPMMFVACIIYGFALILVLEASAAATLESGIY